MGNTSETTPPASKSVLIKDMALDERPREKALKRGIKSLTDIELMAILFATGSAGTSVLDLCREILRDNNNHLSKVARQSPDYISGKYRGVGPAKAITLLAVLELVARAAADAAKVDSPTVNSATIAANCMRHHFAHLNHEEVWVMHLAQNGKIIAEEKISEGGLTSTVVDIKKILKSALNHYAAAIILFHNHPSGALKPSIQDDNLTRRVQEGCKAIDIRMHDHIIVTETDFFSYNDTGRL